MPLWVLFRSTCAHFCWRYIKGWNLKDQTNNQHLYYCQTIFQSGISNLCSYQQCMRILVATICWFFFLTFNQCAMNITIYGYFRLNIKGIASCTILNETELSSYMPHLYCSFLYTLTWHSPCLPLFFKWIGNIGFTLQLSSGICAVTPKEHPSPVIVM